MKTWPCALYLENGHIFSGQGFGAKTTLGGEAVFNTGMTGYQEIFTDPSYYKQIVVMTYPHLGNTGVNREDVESARVWVSGVVTRDYCPVPSNWRWEKTLDDYLKEAGIPAISDIDTRYLTQLLRDEGAQRSVLLPSEGLSPEAIAMKAKEHLHDVEPMEGLELVSRVSCKEPFVFEPGGNETNGTAVVYDFGLKLNTLRNLKRRNFKVQVVPYNYPAKEVLKLHPSFVVLTNGPGDPSVVDASVKEIEGLLGKTPMMAICMGHQLLSRALGCTTYKLKFGHHGINHPVMDLNTGRIVITSQNHGFSVRREDLQRREIEISHVSLNDETVEGFVSKPLKLYSLQFHPEAKPGPLDGEDLFDYFLRGFLK